MVWAARTVLLGLLAQAAQFGRPIPVSLTLARVPVPAGEQFLLSLPARREGESLRQLGSFVLTSGRVRLVRRGRVELDVPLSQIAHLTVKGFGVLRLTVRGNADAIGLRLAQPGAMARYIQTMASKAATSAATSPGARARH